MFDLKRFILKQSLVDICLAGHEDPNVAVPIEKHICEALPQWAIKEIRQLWHWGDKIGSIQTNKSTGVVAAQIILPFNTVIALKSLLKPPT